VEKYIVRLGLMARYPLYGLGDFLFEEGPTAVGLSISIGYEDK
jgi:hypothetical protein